MVSITDLAVSGEEEQERREEDRGQSDQERNQKDQEVKRAHGQNHCLR